MHVFKQSLAFKFKGDKFAEFLLKEDYFTKTELPNLFSKECENISSTAENKWNQICVPHTTLKQILLCMEQYTSRTNSCLRINMARKYRVTGSSIASGLSQKSRHKIGK